jgi:AcrR family transcriptional regulator
MPTTRAKRRSTGHKPPAQAAPQVSRQENGHALAPHDLGRERVIEIQRARIFAAMVEECAGRGAANVTVAHIVARAGVSRRTFYELFSDCEDCFIGAFDESVACAWRHIRDSYDLAVRWDTRIRAALTSLLSHLDTDSGAAQLLVVGSLGAGVRAMERRQRWAAKIVTAVDEGRGESKAGEELPPLTAEGVVGGVLSVLHSRLLDLHRGKLDPDGGSLLELAGPLMSMIVLPYLGPTAARKELARPVPKQAGARHPERNPLGELEMRLTYRTIRVLMAIAAHPGSSNRAIANAAEVTDQGQMSKLLARLHDIGLIENAGGGATRGEPNAWTLTDKGWRVQGTIAEEA